MVIRDYDQDNPSKMLTHATLEKRLDCFINHKIIPKDQNNDFIIICFQISNKLDSKNVLRLQSPESGLKMVVTSDQPGIQFYTGNVLDGSFGGKNRSHTKRCGLCLETQHFPDSPNQPSFPSTELAAGGVYETTTVYQLFPSAYA